MSAVRRRRKLEREIEQLEAQIRRCRERIETKRRELEELERNDRRDTMNGAIAESGRLLGEVLDRLDGTGQAK